MNQVVLIGNLAADPELRKTDNEVPVVKMRLAVRGRGKDPEFIDITAFNGTAEKSAKYLSKGRKIAVQGHLHVSKWETDDGEKRARLEVIADSIEFLSRPSQAASNGKAKAEPEEDEDFE